MMSHQHIRAQIEHIRPLTDNLLQLILTPEKYVDYQAGQYLQIIYNEEAFSYSIANAPLGAHKYELHIRHSPDIAVKQPFLAAMKQTGHVTLHLPFGECDIRHLDPVKPILFIAGGTGFAPIKAMIEQLLANGEQRPFELYWGARSTRDLYMNEQVAIWQNHVLHFHYFSQCSDTNKTTLASSVLKRHANDIQDWQMVISGPFDMVYNTRDELIAGGAIPAQLFSDAFKRIK